MPRILSRENLGPRKNSLSGSLHRLGGHSNSSSSLSKLPKTQLSSSSYANKGSPNDGWGHFVSCSSSMNHLVSMDTPFFGQYQRNEPRPVPLPPQSNESKEKSPTGRSFLP
mmetsp:Transcript_69783/g.103812  ORF Transcript_69783/g.103812 Transcript_69783/m.103812 type:complete len:111 (+) Transcript_69783:225-557(+)